jgi:cellobiose-specific phosphotransferase system component IIB
MDTLLVQPQNAEQLKTVKSILKALKVDFKAAKKSDYNPIFVAKIKESRKQVKEGKVTFIKTKNLWK